MNPENFDFSQLGDRISTLVDDAIHSQNFEKLNENISHTLNQAAEGISRTVSALNRNYGGKVYHSAHPYERPGEGQTQAGPQRTAGPRTPRAGASPAGSVKAAPEIYAARPGGQIAATLKALFGYSLAAIGAILLIVLFILFAFGLLNAVTGVLLGVVVMLLLGGALLGYSGTRVLSRLKRFREYRRIIGDRSFIDLDTLAKESGRSKKFLLRDLADMAERRFFRQAHFDQKQTCLMLTDEVYRQYQETQRSLEERTRREAELERAGFTPEFREILRQSEDYIRRIREANDALPGEVISQKLERLELVISRILEEVKKQPEKATDLQKFMNYYLPTTWKLINAYQEFETQPVQTENIRSTRLEIERTLDTINAAFETLLDDLFQSTAWDISTDISVLQTMFAQEGLTKTGPSAQMGPDHATK